MAELRRMTVTQYMKSINNQEKQLRWSDIPEVKESLTFMSRNSKVINLNEIKFEIISQESSFNLRMRSLLSSFSCLGITAMDRTILFSSMEKVLKVSDDFLADLEKCWQKDIFLPGIFDVIQKHEVNFEAYAKHCSNQKSIVIHLERLKAENPDFGVALEGWSHCSENYSRLTLNSFLDLPKGRMTCLATATENASLLMEKHDPDFNACIQANKSAKKAATLCDQAVATATQRTQLLEIFDQLSFLDHVTPIPIASSSRVIVKVQDVTLLTLAGTKVSKRSSRHLILFNDYLLVTKKTKRDRYEIHDYCALSQLELKNTDDLLSLMKSSHLAGEHKKLLLLKLNQNHEKRPLMLLLSLALEAKCDEWRSLLEDYISRNNAQPPVELQQEPPEPHKQPFRSSVDLQVIEELKKKQEARKRDWVVTHEIVEHEVADKLGNVRDRKPYAGPPQTESGANNLRGTKPYLIPRPASTAQPLNHQSGRSPRNSHHFTEPPVVPAKPRPKDVSPGTGEATVTFDSRIEYPEGMPVFPLVSASRYLLLEGDMTLQWRAQNKTKKTPLHVALFNDVLFITTPNSNKKTGKRYKVLSYCLNNLVDITRVKQLPHLPSKLTTDRTGKYPFIISILENHKRVAETMVVTVGSTVERDSWLSCHPTPAGPDSENHVTYNPWDCPHVMAIKTYTPTAAGHMELAVHDKIHVTRRRADGWLEGERVSDGQKGVFPASHVIEVDSVHKHAKDVRLQYTVSKP